nr:hypothetical protein B0A51_13853 [Rachicladosporium sp. CCFEE 5018]
MVMTAINLKGRAELPKYLKYESRPTYSWTEFPIMYDQKAWDVDPPVPPTPLPPLPPSAPRPPKDVCFWKVDFIDADPPVPRTPLPPLPPSAPRPRNAIDQPSATIDADPPVPPTRLPPLPPPAPRPRSASSSLPDLNKALSSPPASPRVPPHPHPAVPPEALQPVRVSDDVHNGTDYTFLAPALSRLYEDVTWLVNRLQWPVPRPPCPRPPPRPSPGGPPPSPMNGRYCAGRDLDEGTTCENSTDGWCQVSLDG